MKKFIEERRDWKRARFLGQSVQTDHVQFVGCLLLERGSISLSIESHSYNNTDAATKALEQQKSA